MRSIQEIERERKEQRISKQMLFQHSGVSAETYRRTLNGITAPNTRTLDKLDEALCKLRIGGAKSEPAISGAAE